MKLKALLALGVTVTAANAATSITLRNFDGGSGLPIVDNTGTPIVKDGAAFAVGTFDSVFAGTLGTLDTVTSDAAVIAAFQSAGDAGSFAQNGLFSGTVEVDSDGSLGAGEDTPLYGLITYDDGGGTVQAMVVSFGTNFPKQNDAGAAAEGFKVDETTVVFGNPEPVPNNDQGLPGPLQGRYAQGLTFDAGAVIPEPSTSLLAGLAGLALAVRRRR